MTKKLTARQREVVEAMMEGAVIIRREYQNTVGRLFAKVFVRNNAGIKWPSRMNTFRSLAQRGLITFKGYGFSEDTAIYTLNRAAAEEVMKDE